MVLFNFNSNKKSWKIYSNTITSISSDDILIKPYNSNNLILEVSANNNIIFKKGETSYSITTKIASIDSSFVDVYTTFSAITSSFSDVTTKFNIIDASFNNKLASISGNLIPLNDICYNLGSETKKWANAYIRDISVTNISASGNIVPLVDLNGSLGTSNNIWFNAFISDISGLVNINGQPYGGGSGTNNLTSVTTNINPSIDNSGSLGIASRKWNNAYINDLSVSSIDVSVNINPLNNNGSSLGIVSKYWNNAFIRDLSVSSIDLSVNINPLNNNGSNLGTTLKRWGSAYINTLNVSSIDVSVSCNPLNNNGSSLGVSNDIWGDAYIRNINASSIIINGNLLPLTNYSGSLGNSSTFWGSAFINKLTVMQTASTANVPGTNNVNGVGLFIENPSSLASQRAILFLQCSNSSANSRAAIAIEVGYIYGWQISVRQENAANSLIFNNAAHTSGGTDVVRFNANGTGSCTGALTQSDDRLKHNEVIINNGLVIIDQLVPKFYQKTLKMLDARYYGDLSGYIWNYEVGLIAQEVLQINDISFVVSDGDYYDSNNVFTRRPYSINYNNIFVYGLAAIKELHTKVKTQESIIVNLQSTMLNQQTTITNLISRIQALKNKV